VLFFRVDLREKASLLGTKKERNLLNNSSLAFKALVGCPGRVLVPCQTEPWLHPASAALLVQKPSTLGCWPLWSKSLSGREPSLSDTQQECDLSTSHVLRQVCAGMCWFEWSGQVRSHGKEQH